MEQESKARSSLLAELTELRQRVRRLEAEKAARQAIDTAQGGSQQRLEYLLSVSPAIIYTTQAAGDFRCTYVSDNLHAIMGYTPQEMTTDPKCWPARLNPEDAPRVLKEVGELHRKSR